MTEIPIEIDETLPETVKGFLRKGYTLENITLHEQGHWTHEGLFFENQKVIDLFSRSVARTAGGTWVLDIPPFTYPIEVEDVGFFVTHASVTGDAPSVTVTDGYTYPLDPSSIRYAGGGRLYCAIRDGDFEARFLRSVYHGLADHMREQDGRIVLAVGGEDVALSDMDDAPV